MARSKKKRKKDAKRHDQHHQALHDYVLQQIHAEDQPDRVHVMPLSQPWHVALPWCFCQPNMTDKHPLSGGEVWEHNGYIH